VIVLKLSLGMSLMRMSMQSSLVSISRMSSGTRHKAYWMVMSAFIASRQVRQTPVARAMLASGN
jgi:hypothetical protein